MALYPTISSPSNRTVMKRMILIFLCVLGLFDATRVSGQLLPKYAYTKYIGFGAVACADFHTGISHKFQIIYRPSELPGLPAGPLHSVYLRVGRVYIDPNDTSNTQNVIIYDSMRVRMGTTEDTSYRDSVLGPGQYPSYFFKTGLTQVFFQKTFAIYGADSIGTWVRFPISGIFNYNPSTNLVVELSHIQSIDYGFDWMGTMDCYSCNIAGLFDSLTTQHALSSGQADIGFNDATGAVGGLVNLKGFYTYPNPSEGLFTVGFEPWGTQASAVQVSVSDMAGRQVWQRSYQNVQASLFTANVDLRGRPKGIYLLRVQSGDAQALQRVVVE